MIALYGSPIDKPPDEQSKKQSFHRIINIFYKEKIIYADFKNGSFDCKQTFY